MSIIKKNKIELSKVVAIAEEAGQRILEVYNSDRFYQAKKENGSPLTEADLLADQCIRNRLSALYQKIPIFSEEIEADLSFDKRKDFQLFWLVDPLDGTKEFIKHNGEFTVNIALIYQGQPVMGVVYAPAIDRLYFAEQGQGAFVRENGVSRRLPLAAEQKQANNIRVVVSRSHLSSATKVFLSDLEKRGLQVKLVEKGSSLKICLVAEGQADIYPRLGPTTEWDTAAAHAVLNEAGKHLRCAESGQELAYNKSDLLNPFFIAQ